MESASRSELMNHRRTQNTRPRGCLLAVMCPVCPQGSVLLGCLAQRLPSSPGSPFLLHLQGAWPLQLPRLTRVRVEKQKLLVWLQCQGVFAFLA